eukprot:s2850_g8.t1
MAAVDGRVKGGALELQAEIGMKLLKATEASGAEYDSAAAEAYQKEVETRIAKLETESNQLTGKDNKKERSAKGKEIAELKNEHKYVDACKIVKGLEPKFGHFDNKKEKKEKESAGLSPDELKELDDLKQKIIEDGGGMLCGMPFACLWNIE